MSKSRNRRKRLKTFEKYDEETREVNENIDSIDKKIKILLDEKVKQEKIRDNIYHKEVNEILSIYGDLNLQSELVEEGKKCHFSESQINAIKEKFNNGNWNQDKIGQEDIERIYSLERYLDENGDKTNLFKDKIEKFGAFITGQS